MQLLPYFTKSPQASLAAYYLSEEEEKILLGVKRKRKVDESLLSLLQGTKEQRGVDLFEGIHLRSRNMPTTLKDWSRRSKIE